MELLNIQNQFNAVAKKYDENRRKFIPCFDGFYRDTTDFIASNITRVKSILDLGAGTGLLTAFWYERFPEADYMLVDIAEDMLKIAKERFSGCSNIKYSVEDYSQKLSEEKFDAIISALSVHHLEHSDKKDLFEKIYEKLPICGIFVNYDQFCAGSAEMDKWYDEHWVSMLNKSGLSENDIRMWQERRKLDRECSVEEEIEMLKSCGFSNVKCVYSAQKFAVIVAIK